MSSRSNYICTASRPCAFFRAPSDGSISCTLCCSLDTCICESVSFPDRSCVVVDFERAACLKRPASTRNTPFRDFLEEIFKLAILLLCSTFAGQRTNNLDTQRHSWLKDLPIYGSRTFHLRRGVLKLGLSFRTCINARHP